MVKYSCTYFGRIFKTFFVILMLIAELFVIWRSLLNFTIEFIVGFTYRKSTYLVILTFPYYCFKIRKITFVNSHILFWYLYWLSYWKILFPRIRCFLNNLFSGEPYSSFRYLVFFANLHLPSRLKRFFSSPHGWCLLSK